MIVETGYILHHGEQRKQYGKKAGAARKKDKNVCLSRSDLAGSEYISSIRKAGSWQERRAGWQGERRRRAGGQEWRYVRGI